MNLKYKLFDNYMFSVGETVLCLTDTYYSKQLRYNETGIIVKIYESKMAWPNGSKVLHHQLMYDVLLESGELKVRSHRHLQPVINYRQDGVDDNG